MGGRHDVKSHAHEDIPGTVDLRAKDGEETHYGQALFPVPSADPNDPLQWPVFKKNMILFCCALYSFLGNSALLGPSVYIGIFSESFGIDPNTAAGLINYPNLAFGFGSLLLVPAYHKFGRRPIMLLSMLFHMAGLLGAAQATTYSGLMACRIIHGFGSGVCEALPVQLVNDIFFLHERGKKIGWYTCALCMGATGPLYAGYMLAGGYGYNLFFYVELAFAGALFILAFFFVEESRYTRVHVPRSLATPPEYDPDAIKLNDKADIVEFARPGVVGGDSSSEMENGLVLPRRKSLAQQLKPWSGIDHTAQFFLTSARSFTYLLIPSVVWVITTYGLYIGLCGLSFNFVFPIKIVAPPYNWSQTNSGLIALATIAGYLLALPLLPLVDRWAAYLTTRNEGIREAEMRLGLLLPPMVIAPAGLVLFGMTAEKNLHWMGYFAAVAITQWAAYFYFTITLTYAADSYTANLSEMLIIMNLGKQGISFGLGLDVLDWILKDGYAKILAGAFVGVLLANNMAVIPFMIWGKKIRIATNSIANGFVALTVLYDPWFAFVCIEVELSELENDREEDLDSMDSS